jgi:hypothetical protein
MCAIGFIQAQTANPALADSLRKAAPAAPAETSNWTITGNTNLNFSQVGLMNWTGGGKNTVSIIGLFTIAANYKGPSISWNNSLELGYGVTKIGDDEFRKSDDRIILVSKAGIAAADHLTYSILLDFRSQFAYGRDFNGKPDSVSGEFPLTSAIMAPGFLTTGIGMEYKPTDYFSLLFAPLTGRTTFVFNKTLSEAGAYNVTRGSNIRADVGGLLNMFFKKELLENVTVQSRINVFSPYTAPTLMIINWENLINLKVNSYLNVSLATDVFYDDRIVVQRDDGTSGPATQLRNTLAIGLGYKF